MAKSSLDKEVKKTAKQRNLELREQIFLRRRIDELELSNIACCSFIGIQQNIKNFVGKDEAKYRSNRQTDDRPDQTRSEFRQMLY